MIEVALAMADDGNELVRDVAEKIVQLTLREVVLLTRYLNEVDVPQTDGA